MSLIACWDGQRLELWDETGERRFLFEPLVSGASEGISDGMPEAAVPDQLGAQTGSALALSSVDAPVAALLLPVEKLLQRPFSLPFEHPRYIDAAMLAQELADQAGAEEDDWWLSWQAARAGGGGVRGLTFALPMALKAELGAAAISSQCTYIGPDIVVRLAARIKPEISAAAVLDADAGGLMLGVYADGVWNGMRRLNPVPGRGLETLAREAWFSMQAMDFDAASMPLIARLDHAWKAAFDNLDLPAGIDWQLELLEAEQMPTRYGANAQAMGAKTDAAFNFRHGAWAVQTDWSKRIGPWRSSAVLLITLCLLIIGQDAWQLQQLQARQEAARDGIEQSFHQVLPGVAMIDPMLQLRQAAGGGASGDAWKFAHHLDAITRMGGKETSLKVLNIGFSDGELTLSGMVPDLAAANRIRDELGVILGRKVDLLDTDLNDKQVRIRLRWAA